MENLIKSKKPNLGFRFANKLVFNRLLKKIGLENVVNFVYGASPMKKSTKEFYASIGIYVDGFYGLTETSGAIIGFNKENEHLRNYDSIGIGLDGS
jgi:long-subunit acyl-CoA synthetase (AMP-forming)